jgi:hypothetical protein
MENCRICGWILDKEEEKDGICKVCIDEVVNNIEQIKLMRANLSLV